MKKKEKIMIGIVLISVLMITISMSYAYFTATFNNVGNRDTSITAAQVGSIRLNAEAATYTSERQYPGEMTVQKFYIEPVGEGKGIYEIDLTGVINESLFGGDVEISLYKALTNEEVTVTKGELTQDGDHYYRVDSLNTNGLTPIYTGTLKNGINILCQEEFEVINQSGLKIRENSSSSSVSKYTYYLVYNYKNNGEQSSQMGTTFSGTISAKLINEISSHTISYFLLNSVISSEYGFEWHDEVYENIVQYQGNNIVSQSNPTFTSGFDNIVWFVDEDCTTRYQGVPAEETDDIYLYGRSFVDHTVTYKGFGFVFSGDHYPTESEVIDMIIEVDFHDGEVVSLRKTDRDGDTITYTGEDAVRVYDEDRLDGEFYVDFDQWYEAGESYPNTYQYRFAQDGNYAIYSGNARFERTNFTVYYPHGY